MRDPYRFLDRLAPLTPALLAVLAVLLAYNFAAWCDK